MGKRTLSTLNHLHKLDIFITRFLSFFKHTQNIHTARFAHPHELESLLTNTTIKDMSEPNLLLGASRLKQLLRVNPTKNRRELGNMLVVAPTRGGKGLLAVSQLLIWPHSVIVNDIKGELFNLTAGYRATLGPVFVIDPTGVGHRYDPTLGKHTEEELRLLPKNFSTNQTKETGRYSPKKQYACRPKYTRRQE